MSDESGPQTLEEFLLERYREAREVIVRAGWPAEGQIAWLTYRRPDGSMDYTAVASGREGDDFWVVGGQVATGYSSVLVVWDAAEALAEVDTKIGLIHELQRMQDEGTGRGRVESTVLAFLARPYIGHPDYEPAWIDGALPDFAWSPGEELSR